jgi:superfamily II DNA helicase RecQ
MVSEWKNFRPDYTYLHTLRPLPPLRVPWFGRAATLDKVLQPFVLQQAGFDNNLQNIRTSVDRPEIPIVLQPLLRGFVNDTYRLEFILGDNSDREKTAEIEKTIIFLDSKSCLLLAHFRLMQYLRLKRFSKETARKTIRRYDANVRPADRDQIYEGFYSPERLRNLLERAMLFALNPSAIRAIVLRVRVRVWSVHPH